MKKRSKCIVACVALTLMLSISAALLFVSFPTKVDNETPANELITKDYPLGKLLKLNAVAALSEPDGIASSNIQDLADWLSIKLECKRQTAPDVYYYIVAGDGYRCFLFTDEDDIITHAFLMMTEHAGKFLLVGTVKNVCVEEGVSSATHLKINRKNAILPNTRGKASARC